MLVSNEQSRVVFILELACQMTNREKRLGSVLFLGDKDSAADWPVTAGNCGTGDCFSVQDENSASRRDFISLALKSP